MKSCSLQTIIVVVRLWEEDRLRIYCNKRCSSGERSKWDRGEGYMLTLVERPCASGLGKLTMRTNCLFSFFSDQRGSFCLQLTYVDFSWLLLTSVDPRSWVEITFLHSFGLSSISPSPLLQHSDLLSVLLLHLPSVNFVDSPLFLVAFVTSSASFDLYVCHLESFDSRWLLLIDTDPCWPTLNDVDPRWRTLTTLTRFD